MEKLNDRRATAFEMIRQGKPTREIAERTGMNQTTINAYRRSYIKAGTLPEDSTKPFLFSGERERKFIEDWNRTVCSIIGDCTIPEHFAEDWRDAVNRIRRFYGLEEQKSEETITPLIQQRSVPVH